MTATLLSGCVIDHTGRSGTFLLKSRMDMLREKNRALEQDLGKERARVDRIEQRASQARRRYADAGASVQALMEDLAYLRGDVASVKDDLGRRGSLSQDMDFRLSGLEGQLVHVEDALFAGLDGYQLAPVFMPPLEPNPQSASEPGPTDPSSVAPSSSGPASEAESAARAPDGGTSAGSSETAAVVASLSEPAEVAAPAPTSGEEVQVAAAPPGPAEVLFAEGRKLYESRKWRDAGRRFLKIRKKHSSSEHALEAQFLLSMCLYELLRYKDALSEFQKVIDARGSTELSAHAMYMQGRSFVKLGTAQDREAAEIFFADVRANWPKSSWAKKARKQLEALRGN
jgi:TolA-binding protein